MKKIPLLLCLLACAILSASAQSSGTGGDQYASLQIRCYYLDVNPIMVENSWDKPMLFVEGLENAIPLTPQSDGWSFIDSVPVGSHCHVATCSVIQDIHYFSRPFLVSGDTIIFALQLEPDFSHIEPIGDKKHKDNAFKDAAAFFMDSLHAPWSDGWFHWNQHPRCYWLARLYYHDWALYYPSMRTFEHAADSAYHYFLYCYRELGNSYHFLYYPIRELETFLGLSPARDITPPRFEMSAVYNLLPNETDTHLTCLLSEWEVAMDDILSDDYRKMAKEKSICHPIASNGTIRFTQSHPFSGWTLYRIQDSSLYFKSNSYFTKKGGSQAYSRPLNADEIKRLESLLMSIHNQKFPPKSIQYVIDGPSFRLEYVLNGQFYSVEYYLCFFPPEVEALSRFLEELYSPPSPKVRRYKRSRL